MILGELSPFKKTYENFKSSQPAGGSGKRKTMDEDDIDDYMPPTQTRRVKKMVIDEESDYNPNPTTDGKSSTTGVIASKKRKPLMLGSDGSDDKNNSYKPDNTTDKKTESNYKVDFGYRGDTDQKLESTDGKGTAAGTTLRKRKNVSYQVDSTGTKEDDSEFDDNGEEDESEYDYDNAYKNLSQYFN